MERSLVHGPGDVLGKPLRLPPWAVRFLYRLYEYDPASCGGITGQPHECIRRRRRALLGVPKGNLKTELMAAVAIEQLAGPTAPISPEVRVAAASFDQADLLFGAAATMIREGPLADLFHVFETEIIPKNQPGRLHRIAAAAGTTDGGRTTCFIADELHEWTGPKRRVHLVNSNSLQKRQSGLELNISTAGFDKDSLLGELYDHGLKIASGEIIDDRFLFEWWESTGSWNLDLPAHLRAAIIEANPCSDTFLDPDRVAARYRDPDVPGHEFQRYHLNRWAVAPTRWMAPPVWSLRAAQRVVADGMAIVLGFDGSASRDNTALIACTLEDTPHYFVIGIWERNVADPGWRVPREAVHARLAAAFARYDVHLMLCDPSGWTAEIEYWAAEWGEERVQMMPQTAERMAPAADRFHASVVAGEMTHDGSPTLARNVTNAVSKETRWGLMIGKESRMSERKVDAAQAAVMAGEARRLALVVPRRSVYEERGLQFV
ncbi:MAG TPA: terminase large subunit [Patescibacteria group bacterium]|nr:terminase large subunit [Patescibacteria group bacterium]